MLLKQIKVPFLPLFTGILVIHGFLGMQNLKSMDAVRSPQKTSVLFNAECKAKILKELIAAKEADLAEVAVDAFILSDQEIVARLLELHKINPTGVSVHLHESNAHNKKTIAALEAKGLAVTKSKQHAKRISIAFKNNNELLWHRRTFCGSYNLTKNAQRNQEMMVLEVNDSPAHAAHKASYDGGTKRGRTLAFEDEVEQVVTKTPTKNTPFDNSTHDLHGSAATFINNTNTGDTIYFASMNYGDKVLHKALVDAAKRQVIVRLLLDADATTENKKLDELEKHGVQIVFPTAKIQTQENQAIFGKNGIFHQKYFVRLSDLLTYVSTANATEHAQLDFNVSTFYPNQKEMARAIIANHQKLAQTGVTYQAYKKSGAQLPKRKSSKKKLILSQEDE